jgi:hypothetical protein
MKEYLVFIRGRSEPIRLSAARFGWDTRSDTNLLAFVDENDVEVARFPLAEVQGLVNAKHYTRPGL